MDIEKIKSELPIIKDMVEENMHTEARARIAHIMGKKKHEKIFATIAGLQQRMKYMSEAAIKERAVNETQMFDEIRIEHGEEIATLLHNAL